MTKTLSLLILAALAVQAQSVRLVNADPFFITSVANASGNASYTTDSTPPSNGTEVFCLVPTGPGLLGDSTRAKNTMAKRTVTAVSGSTFQLLDSDGSTPIAYVSSTAIAMDTYSTPLRYGFCAVYGTYSYNADIGGLMPLTGTTERTRIDPGGTMSTDSPVRYSKLVTQANSYTTASGCDGSTGTGCTTEATKVAAILTLNTYGTELTWAEAVENIAFLCHHTEADRYCEGAKYYINNIEKYLHHAAFNAVDKGVKNGGWGSVVDWSSFANAHIVAAYRIMYSRLDSGEKSAFLAKMMNGISSSCTNTLDVETPTTRCSGDGATYTCDSVAGLSVGDSFYLNDRRSKFSDSAGTLLTLTVTDEVATFTTTYAPSLRNNTSGTTSNYQVLVSGSAESGLNGLQKITVATGTGGSSTASFAAAGVLDGDYVSGVTIEIVRSYNANQQGVGGKITAIAGNQITTTMNLTSYSGGIRAATDAPLFKIEPWSSGDCGAVWFDDQHAEVAGQSRLRGAVTLASSMSTSDTSIFVKTAEVHRIKPGVTDAYVFSLNYYEVLGVTSVDYGTGEVVVTRGKHDTYPIAANANTFVYFSDSTFAGSGLDGAGSYRYYGSPVSNLQASKLADGFRTTLLLGYEDSAARAFAEYTWFYFRSLQYPLWREYFSGGNTYGGSTPGYHWGRFVDFMVAYGITLENTLSTSPTFNWDMLEGSACDVIHRITPGSAVPVYAHMFFADAGSQRNIESDDWNWAAMLYQKYPSLDCWPEVWDFFWNDVVVTYGSTNNENNLTHLTYLTETNTKAIASSRTLLNPWHFWNTKSSAAVSPTKGMFMAASKSGWTSDSSSLMIVAPDDPRDHQSSYTSPGAFGWNRHSEMMAPSAPGTRLSNIALYTNNLLCIGAALSNGCQMKPTAYNVFALGSGASDVTPVAQYASTTARLVTLGCVNVWNTSQNVSNCTRNILHLVTSAGRDHVVTLDNIASTSAKDWIHQFAYYEAYSSGGSEIRQPTAATYSRTGGKVTFRQPYYSDSVLTEYLIDSSGTFLEIASSFSYDAVNDVWNPAAGKAGTRLDLSLSSSTTFEVGTVNTSVNDVSSTHPTNTLLTSDSTHRAMQIVDGVKSWCAVLPRSSTSVTEVTYTTTASCSHVVAGLQPNANYEVSLDAVVLFASVAAGTEGVIEFDGADGDYSITQTGTPPSLAITTSSPLTNATQSSSYSTSIASTGGTGAHTWSVIVGSLPPGLSLTGTTGTATLSGTPTTAGAYTFTVQVVDASLNSDSKEFSLTVDASVSIILSASSTSLTYDYEIGGSPPSAQNLTASCAGGACSSTISSNQTWCTASPSSGATPQVYSISADPTGLDPGNYSATLTIGAVEADNTSITVNVTLNVTGPDALVISPSGSTDASFGGTPTYAVTASGGTPPYTYSVSSGALPTGLILTEDGDLSGTITALGTFSPNICATDALLEIACVVPTFVVSPGTGLTIAVNASQDAILTIDTVDGSDQCQVVARRGGVVIATAQSEGAERIRKVPISAAVGSGVTADVQCGTQGGTTGSFTLTSATGTVDVTAVIPLSPNSGATGATLQYGLVSPGGGSALEASEVATCADGQCTASITILRGRAYWARWVFTGSDPKPPVRDPGARIF